MPCYHPLQASFTIRSDGKKNIKFSTAQAMLYKSGIKAFRDEVMGIPCGKCMGCRLENSRQMGVRCLHEASLYEDNVFVTLTYDPQYLPVNGSISRDVPQDFVKRLRARDAYDRKVAGLSFSPIRTYYCGEYGELCRECVLPRLQCTCSKYVKSLGRPHYHFLLFNYDFKDKVYWRTVNEVKYYISDKLSSLWPFGFSTIGDVTFESACYVARYCTKKVNGDLKENHYKKVLPNGELVSVLPEFAQGSLKPGIGHGWFEKYGMSDIFPLDECVVRGVKCKPPRYYDLQLEKIDPELLARIKDRRRLKNLRRESDNTYDRLMVREKCLEARMKLLVRKMEM